MDSSSIAQLADVLSKGGPVVLLFGIWIAFRAGRTAQEAVKALTDIRDSVVKNGPVLEEIKVSVHQCEETIADIDSRTKAGDLKLQAILAQIRS